MGSFSLKDFSMEKWELALRPEGNSAFEYGVIPEQSSYVLQEWVR
jgi:hypothetical protein